MRNRPVGLACRAVLVVAGSMVAGLMAQGVAAADPVAEQICSDRNDRGFPNHGQCVSTVETLVIQNGNTEAVGLCNLYFSSVRGGNEIPGAPYESQGDCVSNLRALGF